jgi:hypothetical protein
VIRIVNIRELKNRLSAYLRDVKGGDAGRRQRLVDAGVLQPGLPHDPALYRDPPRVKLSAAVVDAALAFTRGER